VAGRFFGIPWLLVAGSAMLLILLLYVLFGAYVPAKQHIEKLEAELREVYTREAALQKRVAELEDLLAERDKQIRALRRPGVSGRPATTAKPPPAARPQPR
jgi:hypothetical protein